MMYTFPKTKQTHLLSENKYLLFIAKCPYCWDTSYEALIVWPHDERQEMLTDCSNIGSGPKSNHEATLIKS